MNQSSPYGNLYLLPTPLGEVEYNTILPLVLHERLKALKYFIAENEKTSRHFIKDFAPTIAQPSLHFFTLNKRTTAEEFSSFLDPCLKGHDMGMMSEAGCPGVADPGAKVVRLAHRKNIRVIPMVGPSSILLAMMASGLNGQHFTFNGYLPIEKSERKQSIKRLEQLSHQQHQAQLCIETPYRNEKLLQDFIKYLHPDTKLCIARELTLPSEFIRTQSVRQWKKTKVDLHKKPTIFIFQKE